jgi:putative PIG3 family NAD(P)H quinone oxidoreductase
MTEPMKAINIKKFGGADVLELKQVTRPVPGKDELLVRVKAAGINRADILQREGKYPAPPGSSQLLGLEISGIISENGHNCERWTTGQKVFGLLGGGGYAEYAIIHQDMAMLIPDQLSFEEAAAIPEAFLTAFQSIVWIGKLRQKENILIHAGASGVGTAAIQVAREIGAPVIVTAGSEKKVQFCTQLGANVAINYKSSDFEKRILEETAGKGVDLILDFVGQSYWDKNLAVLAADGRLIILATMSGSFIPEFDLRKLMRKRMTISGSTLRNRDLAYKIRLTQDFADFALPLFSQNRLKAVVDRIFPWEQVSEAHRCMEENRNMGKLILTIS